MSREGREGNEDVSSFAALAPFARPCQRGRVAVVARGKLRSHLLWTYPHTRTPITIGLRCDFARLDFAAAAPEDVRVTHFNATTRKVRVDGGLVREHELLVGAMRHAHHIYIAKLRATFAPVSVR